MSLKKSKLTFTRSVSNEPTVLRKEQLRKFVSTTGGFNANCFGEIRFTQAGTQSTFAPFVTVSSTTNPTCIWKLLTQYWKLPLPHLLMSVLGSFSRHESRWEVVAKGAWIFTTGSSPFTIPVDSCIIAVVPFDTVPQNEIFYSRKSRGKFPVSYDPSRTLEAGFRHLDRHHTFFIFVEDIPNKTADFRRNLVSQLSSAFTNENVCPPLAAIPVINFIVSDHEEVLDELFHGASNNVLLMTCDSAKLTCKLFKQMNFDSDSENLVQISSSKLWEKTNVLATLKELANLCGIDENIARDICYEASKKMHLFSTSDGQKTLDVSILIALADSVFAPECAISLGLFWNQINFVINTLATKPTLLELNSLVVSRLVITALAFNRSSFLNHLFVCGVQAFHSMTVEMLWSLYYMALLEPSSSGLGNNMLRRILYGRHFEPESLIHLIGEIIRELSNDEVCNMYSDDIYKTKIDESSMEKGSLIGNLAGGETLNNPERDLFIWCLFTERTGLAVIVWKHSHNAIALALLASTICGRAASQLERLNYECEVFDSLRQVSRYWEQVAIQYLTKAFKRKKNVTITQLSAKIPNMGDSSCLTLGFKGNKREFMSQPSIHLCLDLIWFGHTKQNQSMFRPLLAIFMPFLIPCLNVLERKEKYSMFSNQVFHPTYSQEDMQYSKAEEFSPRASTKSASFFDTGGSVSQPIQIVETKIEKKARCAQDVYHFYNSPRITYFTHSIFLVAAILILSYMLIILNATNINFLSFPSQFLFWYMFGLLCDEARQIFGNENKKVAIRFRIWINDPWNILDLVMLTSYFVGLILLTIPDSVGDAHWYAGKLSFSICLVGLYIRVLQAYLVSKNLGPKIYMMQQMVKDTIVFFGIMALIFFSYGVIFVSLKDETFVPNNNTTSFDNVNEFVFTLFNTIILEPYWQIHGNMLESAFLPQNSYAGILRVMLTAVYVLFTSILMVNLLVAMFSFTFQNIQEHSYTIWSYYRYEVVREFSDRPFLPSPLILLSHAVRFCYWICGKSITYDAFRQDRSTEEENFSQEIETFLLNDMRFPEHQCQSETNSNENLVDRQARVEAKVDEILLLLNSKKEQSSCPQKSQR